jgi:hypothetical protein
VQGEIDQVLRKRRRKRGHDLDKSEHEAELGHAEPLAAEVAGSHEAGTRTDRNNDLREQQHSVAVGIGENEDAEGHQGD